jgi:hypothetical protein
MKIIPLLAVPLALAAAPQAPVKVATQLSAGMQLVYVSDGRTQSPWVVDSVQVGQQLRPGADCASLQISRRPSDPRPDRSKLCLAGDTLYRWSHSAWEVFRPVGPDMDLTLLKSNGDSVRYETEALGEDMISGTAVQVVSTTVTTVDGRGNPRLRVRERYAVTLATATSGTFESPDPSGPGRWTARHKFELKSMRPGP